MRRIHVHTGPTVLGALLAVSAHAVAQDEPNVEAKIDLEYRVGQEVRVRDLGEFLRDRVRIGFVEKESRDIPPFEVTLVVETLSRESACCTGKHDSGPVEVAAGKSYPGSTFIPEIDHWIPQLDHWVPSRDGSMVLGRMVPSRRGSSGPPPECEDATHSVRLTVHSAGDQMVIDGPLIPQICMIWRP